MAELMVHGMKIPVVEVKWQVAMVLQWIVLVDIKIVKVKIVDTEKCNLNATFSGTKDDFVLSVILWRANELDNAEAVLLQEILSHQFGVSVKPYVLQKNGHGS